MPVAGTVLRIATPGATISGFITFWTPSLTSPRELKGAITPLLSTAPTVNAVRATPGELIVRYAGPLLPAATTDRSPAAVALSTA